MSSNAAIVAKNTDQSTHNAVTTHAATLLIIETCNQYIFDGKFKKTTPSASSSSSSSSPTTNQQLTYSLSSKGDTAAAAKVNANIMAFITNTRINRDTKLWILDKLKPDSPLDDRFDMIRLPAIEPDSPQETIWFLPFREVFATVYAVVSDLSETAWPIPEGGSPEERLARSKAEQERRLGDLDLVVKELARTGVCRTGERHAFVQCLDGYQGKALPVNAEHLFSQTIWEFILNTLRERLEINLPTDKDPVDADRAVFYTKFRELFLPWLLEGTIPQDALTHFIPEQKEHSLATALQNAFARIGITPDQQMAQRIQNYSIQEGIQYIPCNFIPFLATLHEWLARHASFRIVKTTDLTPKEALAQKVIDWLDEGFAEMSHSLDGIQTFYLLERLFAARTHAPVSPLMLAACSAENESIKADYLAATAHLQQISDASFNALLNDPEQLAELEKNLKTFEKAHEVLARDTKESFITNFFATWFSSKDIGNLYNRAPLFRTLSEFYFNEQSAPAATSTARPASPIIYLSDANLADIRMCADNDGSLWVNVYHVNRVLLHALCYPPAQWSSTFSGHLTEVLSFIRAGFNATEPNANQGALQQNSYPQKLLAQVDALLNQHNNPDQSPGELKQAVLTPALITNDSLEDAWIYLSIMRDPLPSENLLMQFVNANTLLNQDIRKFVLLAASLGYTTLIKKLMAQGGSLTGTNASSLAMTPLQAAASNGHLEVVQLLLDNGVKANDTAGRRALNNAVSNGREAVVELLVSNHADINAGTPLPLRTAIESNNLNMVCWLLERGALLDCDTLNSAFRTGHSDVIDRLLQDVVPDKYKEDFSPILSAARFGHSAAVSKLIAAGFDVNATTGDGWNALHEAVNGGHVSTVVVLLNAKTNVNARTKWDQSPLGTALRKRQDNQDELVELLLAQPEIDLNDGLRENNSALHNAIASGNSGLVARLLTDERVNINGLGENDKSFLHYAARYETNTDIVRLLIRAGLSVEQRSAMDRTPLYEAHPGIVPVLCKKKANMTVRDGGGDTPLMYAMKRGNFTLVYALIAHGANPNIPDRDGNTALHIAASLADEEPLTKLLEHPDINVNAWNKRGETPAYSATIFERDRNLIRLLNDKRVQPFIKKEKGASLLNVASPKMSAILLAHPGIKPIALHWAVDCGIANPLRRLMTDSEVDINQRDHAGKTIVHKAVLYDNRDVSDTIIDRALLYAISPSTHTFDFNAQDAEGNTPFHLAIDNLCLSAIRKLHALLKTPPKINPDLQNAKGETLLHLAVKWGREELTVRLLNAGANPEIRNREGKTPVEMTQQEPLLQRFRDIAFIPYLERYMTIRNAEENDESIPRRFTRFFGAFSQDQKKSAVESLIRQLRNPERFSQGIHIPDTAKQGRLGELMACYLKGTEPDMPWLNAPDTPMNSM